VNAVVGMNEMRVDRNPGSASHLLQRLIALFGR